jgi:hypothetical protein
MGVYTRRAQMWQQSTVKYVDTTTVFHDPNCNLKGRSGLAATGPAQRLALSDTYVILALTSHLRSKAASRKNSSMQHNHLSVEILP